MLVSFGQKISEALTFIYKTGTLVIFPSIFHGMWSFVQSPLDFLFENFRSFFKEINC